jgi:hypothetical protein
MSYKSIGENLGIRLLDIEEIDDRIMAWFQDDSLMEFIIKKMVLA